MLADLVVDLLGTDLPADLRWQPIDLVTAGMGRRPLSDPEIDLLGPLATAFPVLT